MQAKIDLHQLQMIQRRNTILYTAGTSTDFLTTWRPPAPPAPRSVPDSFAPPAFSGTNTDPDTWLAHFQGYVQYRQLPDDDVVFEGISHRLV